MEDREEKSLSLSNFIVRDVWDERYVTRMHLFSYDNINDIPLYHYDNNVEGRHYYCDYLDSMWKFLLWLNSEQKHILLYLTEKTTVRAAVGVRQRPISEQQIFREKCGNYCITKLMLLREIATQYLIDDILPILFDKTE
jgi:hypothetical protein